MSMWTRCEDPECPDLEHPEDLHYHKVGGQGHPTEIVCPLCKAPVGVFCAPDLYENHWQRAVAARKDVKR